MTFRASPKVTPKVAPKVTFRPEKVTLGHFGVQKVTFGVTFGVTLKSLGGSPKVTF